MRFYLSTKIFLSIILITVVFSAVSILSLYRMMHLRNSIEVFRKGIVPLRFEIKNVSDSADRLLYTFSKKDESRILIIEKWIKFFDPFLKIKRVKKSIKKRIKLLKSKIDDDSLKLFNRTIFELEKIETGNDLYRYLKNNFPEVEKEVSSVLGGKRKENSAVFSASFELLIKKLEKGDPLKDDVLRFLKYSLTFIKRKVSLIQRQIIRYSENFNERSDTEESQSILTLIIILSFALILSITILLIVNSSLKPIRKLTEALKTVKQGNFSELIEVKASGEIEILVNEFNDMVKNLKLRDRMIEEQREKLIQSERLAIIGKMASFIAHEVRNPLSSMSLNAEILEEELLESGNKELLEHVKLIIKEIERLKTVTEQYLQYARTPEPEFISLNFEDVLLSVHKIFESEVREKGIEFTVETKDSIVARIDPDLIKQALINVVKNSIEAVSGREVKKIEMVLRKENGFAVISVKDTGIGIKEEDKKHIFEPFFSTRKKGTGLGMAITREIVEKHKGKIEINSEWGRGCEVIFKIPLNNQET